MRLDLDLRARAGRARPRDVRAADAARARLSDVPDRHDGRRGARRARARRGAARSSSVPPALGVVPADDVLCGERLPGWARATVDGYAVRAADTYAAAETLPAFLELTGAVAMGRAPDGEVGPGAAMAIPTGGLLPHGADAVVMVEHTTEPMPGPRRAAARRRARRRRAAARRGGRRPATCSRRPGRPLRAADLGLLAAAGVTELAAHARPRVGIVSTGDEIVPPSTRGARRPARCATPARRRWPGSCARPAASRCCAASSPTTRPSSSACSARRSRRTTSSSSPPAPRSAPATSPRPSPARLGEVVCHGLAIKPGKPTLLADCGGVPLIGLPGQPALRARRLPPRRHPARAHRRGDHGAAARRDRARRRWRATSRAPPDGSTSSRRRCATASRRRASAPPRCSARWCDADGCFRVPEAATGLGAGTEVDVELYG